jgi:hypothetical protein
LGGRGSLLLACSRASLPFTGGRSLVALDLTLHLGGCRATSAAGPSGDVGVGCRDPLRFYP